MTTKEKDYKKSFIKWVVEYNARPSFSGTSSGAIALCAAKAASMLKDKVFYTTVFISPFLYLNSAHIGIPLLGRCGLQKIVAAGLVAKNPEEGLHVMNSITRSDVKKIDELANNPTLIHVEIQYNTTPIFCRVIAVDAQQNVADVIISKNPTNFTSIKFNNEESIKIVKSQQQPKKKDFNKNDEELRDFVSAKDAYELVKQFKLSDLQFLEDHIKTNRQICDLGIKTNDETSISQHYIDAMDALDTHGYERTFWMSKILRTVTSGIDARMNGIPLPCITSATNGDHGIVAVVMPVVYGEIFKKSKEKIYQAVLLSHFITWKISINIGKLCIMCGTAVAAVAGALAGIAYLNDMPWEKVQNLLNMHLAQQNGTLCYGSSPSCAFQVMCAIVSGLTCYDLVNKGGKVLNKDGIVSDDFEKTLNNLRNYNIATRDEAVNVIVDTYQKSFRKMEK